MKALGMIEVYGYLAAIEALDSALKAANVSLTDVVRVKGGLVTVLVNGDVGAVKAAMDASAAAAERVGQVISVHVIPRPAADVERMLSAPEAVTSKKDEAVETEKTEETEETEDVKSDDGEPAEENPVEVDPSDQERSSYSQEQLEKMTVANLRKLAREIGDTGMTREEIRFAKKQELISAVLKFVRQGD